MEIVWSPIARKGFDNIVLFLERKWEKKVIVKLFSELEASLKLIGKNPYLFPVISVKKQIGKCVIRRRTLLFYNVDEKNQRIEVVKVVEGRINPLKYKI